MPERIAVPVTTRNDRLAVAPRPSILLRWLVWGPAAVVILSAFVATGGIALFLLPLMGVLYLVFCLIAWQADGEVE